jgi:hypothetical protein
MGWTPAACGNQVSGADAQSVVDAPLDVDLLMVASLATQGVPADPVVVEPSSSELLARGRRSLVSAVLVSPVREAH